jgi:SAM-dependent methyltransferase
LQGERGDDFYTALVLPAVLRQLRAREGESVLDVCCGQGVLGRVLNDHGIRSLGIDASPTLIAAATSRARPLERYRLGDARALSKVLGDERFDHAALVMALQDLDPIQPVLAGIAAAVRPGGRVVMVMTHPVFRIPRRTTWGFDEDTGVQYRRLDGYLSPMRLPIRTHPGMPNDTTATSTFHRPLHTYLNACGAAGLGIIACEELCSHRRGTKGPRFGAEDRAAKEFPVFLVLTAQRLAERP